MPQRKLASVLPEPVGAQISAFSPPAIASQPPAWAGVGPSKEASNQRRVAGENGASGSDFVVLFDRVANPSILRTHAGGPESPLCQEFSARQRRGVARRRRR